MKWMIFTRRDDEIIFYGDDEMNKKELYAPGEEIIETERLILRRFTIEDAEDMFNGWCNDPEVTRFLTWPPHDNVEVT